VSDAKSSSCLFEGTAGERLTVERDSNLKLITGSVTDSESRLKLNANGSRALITVSKFLKIQ
jgi:hypothetical protein